MDLHPFMDDHVADFEKLAIRCVLSFSVLVGERVIVTSVRCAW